MNNRHRARRRLWKQCDAMKVSKTAEAIRQVLDAVGADINSLQVTDWRETLPHNDTITVDQAGWMYVPRRAE